MMKRVTTTLFFLICFGILFWSCERSNYPTDASTSEQLSKVTPGVTGGDITSPSSVIFPQSVVLAGFTVTYNGRTLANNQTTFSYTVTGPAVQIAFRLELPACAPALATWDPTNGKQTSNDADIDPGIEWSPNVGSGSTSSYNFTLTYPGTVKEGIILAKVKSTSTTEVGLITGACARVYDISGSVFTDGNDNGVRDGAETGILGTSVRLCDALGALLESATTDANGNFIFRNYPAGNYLVKVDTGTVAGTQTTYLGTTTPTVYNVTVGPNSSGNNFGFSPKTSKLVNDLKFGTLPTTGLTPGFWKKQFQSAISGSGNPVVSKDSLLVFISRIRVLLLTEPYQLGTGDGLAEGFSILSKPIKSDLDELMQQLLALELNHVSGHGIVTTDPSLQLTLIGWGEALVANTPASATVLGTATTFAAATYSDASGVYSGINKSSGGGGSY